MRLAEPSRPVAACRLTAVAVLLLALVLPACTTTTTTTALPSDSTVPTRTAPDPSDAERRARVRVELAAGYFARGQSEVALEEIRLALAAKPDFADAYTLRGLVYAGMGDIPKAEDSFREALRLNPRDADAMHNWGWVMCQQGRYGEADAMFERALAQPRYAAVPRTLLARGACQARDGKWAEAEVTLSRAYELDPANPATAFNLSEVLLRRGEYERARFYIGRVNAQPDQSNAQTLWLAARIEHRMGNADGVAMYGRQLKSRFPQSPEALAFDRGRFND